MNADSSDEKHEHRGIRERLECDPVKIGAHRRDDCEREESLDQQAWLQRRKPARQREDRERQKDCPCKLRERGSGRKRVPAGREPHDAGETSKPKQKPNGCWRLSLLECCKRQGAIGDELALRKENDACDREDEHERECEKRIDRA